MEERKVSRIVRYDDIPFLHRDWKSKEQESLLHGHLWKYDFIFHVAESIKDTVDFKWLQEIIENNSHATIISGNDPELEELLKLAKLNVINLIVLTDSSVKGLVFDILKIIQEELQMRYAEKVTLEEITIFEEKNRFADWKRT
jgi:hypothetical protein